MAYSLCGIGRTALVLARHERLALFFERLLAAPGASNFDEAFRQLHDILNAVEDQYSGVPYNPPAWQTDGRLYPPLPDSEKVLDPPQPGVRFFKTRGHSVFVGANGSIEIRLKRQSVVQKPGADGRRVWEQ